MIIAVSLLTTFVTVILAAFMFRTHARGERQNFTLAVATGALVLSYIAIISPFIALRVAENERQERAAAKEKDLVNEAIRELKRLEGGVEYQLRNVEAEAKADPYILTGFNAMVPLFYEKKNGLMDLRLKYRDVFRGHIATWSPMLKRSMMLDATNITLIKQQLQSLLKETRSFRSDLEKAE